MIKKIIQSGTFLATLVMFPSIAFAQRAPDTRQIDFYIAKLFEYARMGITFLMVIATLWFIWTVIKFMTTADAGERAERRSQMIAGLIGLTVIICMWGIVYFIGNTLGISGGAAPGGLPCPPGTRPVGPSGSCI